MKTHESRTMTCYILIIAHPDDESMFFLPTLYTLVNNSEHNFCSHTTSSPSSSSCTYFPYPMAITINGYDSRKELLQAAAIISDKIEVTIIHDWKLQDGPNESWSSDVIREVLRKFLKEKKITQAVLLTFDELGVSGHVNHMDVHKGVMDFYHKKIDIVTDLELWTLYSVKNVFVKYLPLGDIFKILYLWCQSLYKIQCFMSCSSNKRQRRFMMLNPALVWRAMKAHHTQFVWYRKLFVIFSRYSYVNDWKVHSHSRNDSGRKIQ
jgi:Uncharacterized proteins, LmbE homologs